MELWEDISRSKYFALDTQTGCVSECDKYGKTPTRFTPYSSGYRKNLTLRITSPEYTYRIQPKKFDGYFQCPRPVAEVKHKSRIHLSDDISTLPRPVTFLQFSSIYDQTVHAPLHKSSSTLPSVICNERTLTLEKLKQSMIPNIKNEVKTLSDFEEILKKKNKMNLSFKKKDKKPERRKLKGFFMMDIPSSVDLHKKEKEILISTNPVSYTNRLKYDEMDRMYFEKTRKQKLLKEKLSVARDNKNLNA
ncbi:hypothetical protein SteCoe_24451 [Stentor coeruleus]|uniref:Enkurin domain-containing protein n=1 Tax=Stentor coeruleus TaxID=5963 RepID=A0A1R2BHJ7_9CILI|nr:hypothetical protein SteCoe_24451 [Stentor coeruleus]